MPRVRFNIGKMMVAVAIAGLVLSGFVMAQRSKNCHNIAQYHANVELLYLATANMARATPLVGIEGPGARLMKGFGGTAGNKYAEVAAYHASMKTKYERAARYPWLAVEPDPPEPK